MVKKANMMDSMEVAIVDDSPALKSTLSVPLPTSTATIEQYRERFQMLKPGDADGMEGETIQLFYIPVTQAILWDKNAKLHSIPALIDSIKEYGFRDPPSWDEKLEGIIEGNGRITALKQMYEAGGVPPRGIPVLKDGGEWCVPILFGLDAANKSNAVRYAIDHNNLTMMGGDFTLWDIKKMWNHEGYMGLLSDLNEDGGMLPFSVNADDFTLFQDTELGFDAMDDLTHEDDLEGKPSWSIKIVCSSSNYFDDIKALIREQIEEHPEWEATFSAG